MQYSIHGLYFADNKSEAPWTACLPYRAARDVLLVIIDKTCKKNFSPKHYKTTIFSPKKRFGGAQKAHLIFVDILFEIAINFFFFFCAFSAKLFFLLCTQSMMKRSESRFFLLLNSLNKQTSKFLMNILWYNKGRTNRCTKLKINWIALNALGWDDGFGKSQFLNQFHEII